MTKFAEVVEAASELTLEEQEDVLDILKRRVAERRRAAFWAEVEEARAEFDRGGLKPSSVEEIMRSITE